MTFKELEREVAETLFSKIGNCMCGSDRVPVRTQRGVYSLLLCKKCGKGTTERKDV